MHAGNRAMTSKNDRKSVVPVLKLAPVLLVAACGMLSPSGPSVRSGNGVVQELPSDLQAAICEGRAQEAVDALVSEPLVSASDRFYTALALEEAGAGTRARMLYARLMQSGAQDIVRANCSDRVLANGPIVDEAARRLAALSEFLTAMDVNLSPEQTLHEGLPRSGPVRVVDPIKFRDGPPGGPLSSLARPASQSPLGQWFVHLASYRSMDNAMKNKSTLEAKFPALTGLIDQWELDVGGSLAVRLGVRVSDRADANSLCATVKSQQEYCAVIDTSQ